MRRLAISEQRDPETTGDTERAENLASLIFTGGPAAAKTAIRFGPKGFKAAKTTAGAFRKHIMRTLKPILSKTAKTAK